MDEEQLPIGQLAEPSADYPDRVRDQAKEAQRKTNLSERQRLLEEAGKTEADVTPATEQVIQHSERLRRESDQFASNLFGSQSISRS